MEPFWTSAKQIEYIKDNHGRRKYGRIPIEWQKYYWIHYNSSDSRHFASLLDFYHILVVPPPDSIDYCR